MTAGSLNAPAAGLRRSSGRAEAGDLELSRCSLLGENFACMSRQARIRLRTPDGGEQVAQREPGFRGRGPQEGGRLLDQETAPIPVLRGGNRSRWVRRLSELNGRAAYQ